MDNRFGKPEEPKKNKLLYAAVGCVALMVGIILLLAVVMLMPASF